MFVWSRLEFSTFRIIYCPYVWKREKKRHHSWNTEHLKNGITGRQQNMLDGLHRQVNISRSCLSMCLQTYSFRSASPLEAVARQSVVLVRWAKSSTTSWGNRGCGAFFCAGPSTGMARGSQVATYLWSQQKPGRTPRTKHARPVTSPAPAKCQLQRRRDQRHAVPADILWSASGKS